MTEQVGLPLVSKAITYNGKGGYEVIEIIERTVRGPASGEVRVEVKAAAVNPTDMLLRAAGYGENGAHAVPGMDLAGIVESVGAGVTRLRAGQKIMAAVMPRRPDGGAQAEHVVLPEASVVAIPDGKSFEEACTLPMNGLTALRALELASLKKGEVLAVSGGAGLLAQFAIAAAKNQGLKIVADAKAEEVALVKSYGADVVVERGADFAKAVRHQFPHGVDALLDTALLAEKSFGAIRDGGVYIPVRGWGEKPGERDIKIKPVFVTEVLERTEWLEELSRMVTAKEIKLRVAGEFAPDRVADAQRAIAAGGLRGRPVIVFRR